MKPTRTERNASMILGWLVAFLMFFPLLWMLLASFKQEIDAVATPPLLVFSPTLENYAEVHTRGNYLGAAWNSVVISVGATVAALVVALPAAYAMAFFPTRRTKDLLVWMMSTKMLPAVGVLMPIYLMFRDAALLDSKLGLALIAMLTNLPIVVWLLYSFLREIPKDIIEASRMDGAGPLDQLTKVLLPLTTPGVTSTALLSVILTWNEAFWSINLTAIHAAPLTAFIASFSSPEGLFWARLAAASTMAVAPIVLFGWFSQRALVRGLTFGAVK